MRYVLAFPLLATILPFIDLCLQVFNFFYVSFAFKKGQTHYLNVSIVVCSLMEQCIHNKVWAKKDFILKVFNLLVKY